MPHYKDSFCKPVNTRYGTRVAGGAARNYRLGLIANGIDDVIKLAGEQAALAVREDMLARLGVDQVVARASRACLPESEETEL